jgi:1-acyl-sn-glycerol-3-phosphate acyltransferase
MEVVYRPAVTSIRAFVRSKGWKLIVEGAEHLPSSGAAVVAGNHISELDPVIVGLALDGLRRRPRFLAKRELFDQPILGPMLRNIKQIPVDRAGDARSALPKALCLLDEGETIVVFPEGTISTSLVPAEPRLGAARLALSSGVPLVPFATWGGQRTGDKARPRARRDHVALVTRFGAPVPYERDEDPVAVTVRLWDAVGALVEQVQDTYPQTPRGEDDKWWIPHHRGGTAPTPEEAAAERERKRLAREARAREAQAREARAREAQAREARARGESR